MKAVRTGLALLAIAITASASAQEFNVIQTDRSRLDFAFRQMGVPVDGRFHRFTAQLNFDPARPEAASAMIEIDMTSVDAGSPEANDEVAGKPWFNSKVFPTARFVATAIKPLGGNRYEATGKMTIKGRSQDVAAPFTFASQGRSATAEGTFVLKRGDFAIGEGVWADFGTVANEVHIRFRLQAAAGPGRK